MYEIENFAESLAIITKAVDNINDNIPCEVSDIKIGDMKCTVMIDIEMIFKER